MTIKSMCLLYCATLGSFHIDLQNVCADSNKIIMLICLFFLFVGVVVVVVFQLFYVINDCYNCCIEL